jgi:hypothetical protein
MACTLPGWSARGDSHSRRIAADRLILRNILRLAQETSDPIAYANLVQKYGSCCLRLCKLLRKARPSSGRIKTWVWKEIEGYLDSVREWWKKQPPIMVPGWTGPWPPPGPPPS